MPLYPPNPTATTSVAGVTTLDGAAADIGPSGVAAAGSTGKSGDAGHIHPALDPMPPDNGLLGWNFPLYGADVTGMQVVAGKVYLAKLIINRPVTITNLWLIIDSAGSGATSGTFVGLYSSAGAKLTGSADVAAAIQAFSNNYALTTPQALSAGTFVWAALLVNMASTQPQLQGGYGSATDGYVANTGLANAQFAFGDTGSGLTALPSSFTPSALDEANALQFWVGYS